MKFKKGDKVIVKQFFGANKNKKPLALDKIGASHITEAIKNRLECEVKDVLSDTTYPYRIILSGERTDDFNEDELEFSKISSWKDRLK